jgi:hypothetical protein
MINFFAKEIGKTQSCKNCLFEHERAKVCHEVTAIARAAQLPDCDDLSPSGNYIIYIAKEIDPRQVDLF